MRLSTELSNVTQNARAVNLDVSEGLNQQQQLAVLHDGGPLEVVAGAGTGKTRLIVHRLAYLIKYCAMPPETILALTFTNQAACEMRTRVTNLVGPEAANIHVGTYHWLGHRILRRYGRRLSTGSGFRLLTPSQSLAVLRQVIKNRAKESEVAGVGQIWDAVRAHRNLKRLSAESTAGMAPSDDEKLSALVMAYVASLREQRAMDLDDLILESLHLLSDNHDIRSRLQEAFAHILVDEYQDTNPPQTDLLRLLVRREGNITVVGDDDQAIYGWRHASPGNMLHFSEQFPGTTIVRLEQNYRSTQRILQPANQLLRHNLNRLGKSLYSRLGAGRRPVIFAGGDESEESGFIADSIQTLLKRGPAHESIAVLLRVHAQSRLVEEGLVKSGIPYDLRSGKRFYERPEVARIIDSLKVLVDPDDARAWEELLMHVPGIGSTRVRTLLSVAQHSGMSPMEALQDPRVGTTPTRSSIRQIVSCLVDLSPTQRLDQTVRSLADLWNVIDDQKPCSARAKEEVATNVEEFISAATEFGSTHDGDLTGFLDRLALVDGGPNRTGVQLLTLHAAKGREFDAVFIPGLEEGLLPHHRSLEDPRQIEEERRLLYVGMTRARHWLLLSYARTRLIGGVSSFSRPSRFLDDMPASMFETRHGIADKPRDRLSRVRLGEMLIHPRWGTGKVQSVEGKGRHTMVSIEFSDGARKRVQLCHAPLKRIS